MGKTKGRIPFTRETYGKLIEAFRMNPNSVKAAAVAVGCSWQLAKRVHSGPHFKHYPWAIPAIELFEEEKALAMARAREAELERVRTEERQRQADFDAARQEEIEALKQENLMLKGARGDVLAAVAIAAELGPAMRTLVKVVNAECKLGPNGELPAIPAERALALIGRHALIMQRAVAAASAVLEQGKSKRGEPSVILGIKPVAPAMSYEDALVELSEAEAFVGKARASGALPARLLEATGEDAGGGDQAAE